MADERATKSGVRILRHMLPDLAPGWHRGPDGGYYGVTAELLKLAETKRC